MNRFRHVAMLMLLLFLTACGNSAARYNNSGNEAYQAEQYPQALEEYTHAKQEDPELVEPYYNSGNTLHRQGELENAAVQLQEVLRSASEGQEELAQNSFYNLGNTYFKQQDWTEAIDAYRRALLLNPNDQDAKHNLELALQNLQQQQQQQQSQQQAQQNQPQQGQGGDQPDQQPQQPQPNEGQEEQEGEGGQGDEEQDQSGQNNQPDQQQQDGQGELSPEEAKQLLDALGQDSQTLQERLQQQFGGPAPPPAQDW
ncbi:MAG: tetratricopeptide repeat protein [Anaerolineae bacterium]|nr:tetratricopeptide repeat protein [Anaerolineae bacterium]